MPQLVTAMILALVIMPGAAMASGGGDPASVPEPAAFALFGLGIVGLAIGRRLHGKRPDPDDRD